MNKIIKENKNIEVEFAIIGTNALGVLLATSLAKLHRRKAAFIGEFSNPLFPRRGLDISVNMLTREKNWRLIKENLPLLRDLLKDFGAISPLKRIDPIFIAQKENGAKIISYMQNIAPFYGFACEKLPLREKILKSVKFRDALMIESDYFFAGANDWLSKNNVLAINSNNIELKRSARGGTKITTPEQSIIAKKIIIIDEMVQKFMPKSEIANYFFALKTYSTMLESAEDLENNYIINVDNGTILWQNGDSGIGAIAYGKQGGAFENICGYFGNKDKLKMAGKAQFTSLFSRDGAGIFGAVGGSKISYIAGFGINGAFLAPSMAKFLVGKANRFENEYFLAHKPQKNKQRRDNICEYSFVIRN